MTVVQAYIMVKSTTGEADRVQSELASIDGVMEAHIVAGDVDFIVTVDVDSPPDVKEIAANAIQNIDGVESTRTYIAMS